MRRKIWFALVTLLCCSAARAAERPVVRDVAVFREGDGARIEISADRPLSYTTYLMPELAKWVIDLPGAASAASGDQSRKMKTPPLERITLRRKEVNGEMLTRIGIDVRGEVTFSIKPDPVDRGRLVALLIPRSPKKQENAALPKPAPTTPQR